METPRLWYIYQACGFIAIALLFALNFIEHSTTQIGIIIVLVVLLIGPQLYEPRLAVISWRRGKQGPVDERHERIFFRAGWYAFHLLLIVVWVYFMVNGATEANIPTLGLGIATTVIWIGFWGIVWWQSRVI